MALDPGFIVLDFLGRSGPRWHALATARCERPEGRQPSIPRAAVLSAWPILPLAGGLAASARGPRSPRPWAWAWPGHGLGWALLTRSADTLAHCGPAGPAGLTPVGSTMHAPRGACRSRRAQRARRARRSGRAPIVVATPWERRCERAPRHPTLARPDGM